MAQAEMTSENYRSSHHWVDVAHWKLANNGRIPRLCRCASNILTQQERHHVSGNCCLVEILLEFRVHVSRHCVVPARIVDQMSTQTLLMAKRPPAPFTLQLCFVSFDDQPSALVSLLNLMTCVSNTMKVPDLGRFLAPSVIAPHED